MNHEHGHAVGTVVSPENPVTTQHEVTHVVESTSTKPPVEFELNEFQDGDWKGFKFVAPAYNSLDAAIETYGADKVLSLLNTQIDSRIRTKVKNGLKIYGNLKGSELVAKQTELASKNSGILFTQDEAAAWRPEVRELSPNQLFKKAKEAFVSAQKETDPLKKMAFMREGQNLLIEAGKLLAA